MFRAFIDAVGSAFAIDPKYRADDITEEDLTVIRAEDAVVTPVEPVAVAVKKPRKPRTPKVPEAK